MDTIVKGGHLRKTACGIISFAPFMATASALALGALLVAASPAGAGSCESPNSDGVYVCTGGAGQSDRTQNLAVAEGGSLMVTDDGTFALDVGRTNGFTITTVSTSGDISINFDGAGRLSAADTLFDIDQDGTGSVYLRTEGHALADTGNVINISTAPATTGDVTVITNGEVTAGDFVVGPPPTSSGGMDAINLDHDGSGTFSITTNNTVRSGAGNGIEVETAEDSGGGTINVNGNVTAHGGGAAAIRVVNGSRELVTVNLNDGVIISTDPDATGNAALNLASVFSSSHIKVSIGDRVSFGEDIISGSGVNGDLVIELRGTREDSDANVFDIGILESGDVLEKTGSGTWTVEGTSGANASFSDRFTMSVNGGRLIWDTETEFGGEETSVSIGESGTLVIDSDRTWNTDITLSGRLALTGNSSSLNFGTLTSEGGEIDVDVDFSGGDGSLSTARIVASEVSGVPVTVNVRAMDGFPEISEDDEDGAISIENLIQATTANADAFRAGRALSGDFAFQLVSVEGGQGRQWTIVAGPPVGGSGGTVHDAFAAVLTHLSQTKMLHERLRNRQAKHNTNVYAKPFTSTVEIDPEGSSAFESKTHGLQFGVHGPLLKLFRESWANNVSFDASVEYMLDETEARVEIGSVEMKTEAVAAAFGATWEHNHTFIDGQVRFANFESDFEFGTERPADPNATSMTTSIEIGYAFERGAITFDDIFGADFVEDVFPSRSGKEFGFADISLVPSLQVAWNGVNYNSYFSTTGTSVRLEDGDTFSGRAGLTALGDWDDIAMHGRLGIFMPLDGEVITQIDDVNMSRDRTEVVFDAGLGLTYSWGDYAIALDASTQQGEEVEGYAGSVGLKYNF